MTTEYLTRGIEKDKLQNFAKDRPKVSLKHIWSDRFSGHKEPLRDLAREHCGTILRNEVGRTVQCTLELWLFLIFSIIQIAIDMV